MTEHSNRRCPWLTWRLRAIRAFLVSRVHAIWRALHRYRQRRCLPVEVLVASRARRRRLERTLRHGLQRLERGLGELWDPEITVVVQQIITTDRQLAGCYQTGQRPDGGRFALIRLALEVNGRILTTDELLAVLVEACIGVATQRGGPSVLVPVELAPAPNEVRTITALRPDPLTSHSNGARATEHVA